MCPAPLHLPPHRRDDRRVAVAQQQRPVAGPVVDQLVAVHVPLAGALGAVEVDGERLQVAQVVGDAVGEEAARLLVQPA